MSQKQFFFFFAVLIMLLRIYLIPISTTDLAIWINEGHAFFEHGLLDFNDHFSIHPSIKFYFPTKISSILFSYLHQQLGLIGVALFTRVVCLITGLIWIFKYKEKLNCLKNLLLLLPFLLGITFFMDRPACFGIFFGSILIPKLSKFDLKDKKSIFYNSVLIILWNNMHSSVFILFPIIIYQILIKYIKKQSLLSSINLFILCLILIIISPIHINIFNYVYETVLTSSSRTIPEWNSIISLNYPYYSLLFIIYLSYLFIHKSKYETILKDTLIFPISILAIKSSRNMIWFFTLYPYFVEQLDLWFRKNNKQKERKIFNFIFISLIIFFTFSQSWLFKDKKYQIKNFLSDELIFKLKENSSILFTESEIAGYIVLETKNKTFLDSRNTIFSDEILIDYNKILFDSSKSDDLLNKYKIKRILLSKVGYPIIEKLKSCNNWEISFENNNFIYFERLDIGNPC